MLVWFVFTLMSINLYLCLCSSNEAVADCYCTRMDKKLALSIPKYTSYNAHCIFDRRNLHLNNALPSDNYYHRHSILRSIECLCYYYLWQHVSLPYLRHLQYDKSHVICARTKWQIAMLKIAREEYWLL